MTATAPKRLPSYRLHKPTGQAFVEFKGKRYYLGKHGSPAAREKYDRFIKEAVAAGGGNGQAGAGPSPLAAVSRLPSFRLHRPSGQAFVEVRRKRYYLGRHDSPAAREKYHRLIAEMLGAVDDPAKAIAEARAKPTRSINELLLAYWQHAKQYYAASREQRNLWSVIELLMNSCGSTPADEFGPLALKEIRQRLIDTPNAHGRTNSRGYINDQVKRIRRIFKWAVAEELVPASLLEGLRAVEGLKFGRCKARETEPVKPVLEQHVIELLPYLAPPVRAMVELQLLTGMRSDNVTTMRRSEIDTSGEVWIYTPPRHKTRHRGHTLQVPLGPQAQAVIRPFLTPAIDDYLFRPADAEAWRSEQRRAARKTPMTPSQAARQKKTNPRRGCGDRYDTASYRRAITYGFARMAMARGHQPPTPKAATREWLASVGVVVWFPHQLRHTRATKVRKQYGLEAAQAALGHGDVESTKLYAEKNFELAQLIAREIG